MPVSPTPQPQTPPAHPDDLATMLDAAASAARAHLPPASLALMENHSRALASVDWDDPDSRRRLEAAEFALEADPCASLVRELDRRWGRRAYPTARGAA